MYVVTRTSATTTEKPLDLTAYINGSRAAPAHCISVVNCVPLLRWVCVTCVYDYDIVSIYADRPVQRHQPGPPGPLVQRPCRARGAPHRWQLFEGFNGYISKVTVASYAQNVWAIKSLYQRGPVSDNWLTSSMGLNGCSSSGP